MAKYRSQEELTELVEQLSKSITSHAEWWAVRHQDGYSLTMLADMLVSAQTAFHYEDLEWGVLGIAVDIVRGLDKIRQQQGQNERKGAVVA